MLDIILAVLVILWLLGLTTHVAGATIHVLLVIAAVLLLIRLIK